MDEQQGGTKMVEFVIVVAVWGFAISAGFYMVDRRLESIARSLKALEQKDGEQYDLERKAV